MSYQSGDDPQLLDDLRAALKNWHRSTMGDVTLATRLTSVERRREANPRLTRTVEDRSVYRLQQVYDVSERSMYYKLQEAFVSLAHALWAIEQDESESARLANASPTSTPPVQLAGPAWPAPDRRRVIVAYGGERCEGGW